MLTRTTALTAALLITGSATAQTFPTGNQELVYNAADGTLTIDTKGETTTGYVLENGPFIEENHDINVFGLVASPTSNDDELSHVINATLPAGVYNLGAVLERGLSKPAFESRLADRRSYVVTNGQPILSFKLVYVPEPGSLALLALGGLALVRRRR